MVRRKGNLAAVLAGLVLLATAAPVLAFGFCFSFGSKTHNRAQYSSYPPSYPGFAAPVYPAYGYSPVVPAYDYGSSYYPPSSPYVTVPPESARR
jgi:hypothetical protein